MLQLEIMIKSGEFYFSSYTGLEEFGNWFGRLGIQNKRKKCAVVNTIYEKWQQSGFILYPVYDQ